VKYVYILQSEQGTEHFYVGITADLDARLSKHNSGEVAHTAKYRPWHIKSYVVFTGRYAGIRVREIPEVRVGQSLRQEAPLAKACTSASQSKRQTAQTRGSLPPQSRHSSAVFSQS
jgi:hypothetical protein